LVRVLAVSGGCCLQGRLRPWWWGPDPRDRSRTRVGGASPRPWQGPDTLECPAPARPPGWPCSGVGTAHWGGQVSKTEEISPGTMQRDTESTPETQRKHRVIARFLEDTPGHRDFNPLRLDTSGPTTPSTDPTSTPPHRNNRHLTRRGPRI